MSIDFSTLGLSAPHLLQGTRRQSPEEEALQQKMEALSDQIDDVSHHMETLDLGISPGALLMQMYNGPSGYEATQAAKTRLLSDKMDSLVTNIEDVSNALNDVENDTDCSIGDAKERAERIHLLTQILKKYGTEKLEGRDKEAVIEQLKRLPARYEQQVSDLMRRTRDLEDVKR